jgi:phage virion morphogenesis protein
MAGASFNVTIDDREVQDLFRRLAKRMTDMTPVMAEIGEIGLESIQRNFEEGRAPDGTPWTPLATSTKKRKRHPEHILIGDTQDLFKSIHPEPHKDYVTIGTNVIYAAVHQFGIGLRTSIATRRTMPAIPARPFLGLRDDDWPEIRDAIEYWIEAA